jgi:5,5'-dehydrodivanillate O-demethylase
MNGHDSVDFVHTGPGTLAGRYMRTFWQPIFVADELLPGWTKPIQVMSEEFTLYRGESGQVHLVGMRCAHRGTQLSTGWVEDDCIRCLYHGWKYDGTGRCIEQPGEASPFASTVTIPSYPTREYLGLIFAYLGEGAPPPFPRYPTMELDGVLEAGTYTRASNFFNNIENGVDLYHVAWAHRDAHMQHSLDYTPGALAVSESEWGVTASVTLGNGSVRTNQFGMPNILHFRSSEGMVDEWTEVLGWRIPIDDTSHLSFNLRFHYATGEAAERLKEHRKQEPLKDPVRATTLGQAALRGELRMRDLRDERGGILVNVQDDVTQVGQGAIADREHERRGSTDVGIVLLRQIWERELRALAEGRPLKAWVHSEGLVATSGR